MTIRTEVHFTVQAADGHFTVKNRIIKPEYVDGCVQSALEGEEDCTITLSVHRFRDEPFRRCL